MIGLLDCRGAQSHWHTSAFLLASPQQRYPRYYELITDSEDECRELCYKPQPHQWAGATIPPMVVASCGLRCYSALLQSANPSFGTPRYAWIHEGKSFRNSLGKSDQA